MPEITLTQNETSSTLSFSHKDGTGSMVFFPLFPGITLAYISIHAPFWPAPAFPGLAADAKGPLLINYCVDGRCELILNNENFVYIKNGEISLSEHFAENHYIYPSGLYDGLEFFLDLETIQKEGALLSEMLGLDLSALPGSYCAAGKTYISGADSKIRELCHALFLRYDPKRSLTAADLTEIKLLSLHLFFTLCTEPARKVPQPRTFYNKTQVEIAKRTAAVIAEDLRRHYPARELAASFSISETSLKNYFRGVFGQNLSDYQKNLRMDRAATLLTETRLSVAEIAEQVGYLNQSKFAAVFKKHFQMSPLAYRRASHLKNMDIDV